MEAHMEYEENLRGRLKYIFVFLSILTFTIVLLKFGWIQAIAISFIPLLLFAVIQLVKVPIYALFCVFIVNYFIMGVLRYIPGLQGGMVIDGLLLVTIFILLIYCFANPIPWRNLMNPLTILTGIWLVYCSILIFNPETSLDFWAAGVRSLAVYFFVFPVLITVLLNKYKYLKLFLFIWSVLTLSAIVKSLIQKFIGFDSAELYWLHVTGGSRTHIISTGVRYFSFFTDAASFGCNMGMSMVVFGVTALYIRSKPLRIFYITVALLAAYAMMISGTRAAIFVPFAGFATFLFLSKQWKIMIPGLVLIMLLFVFFKFTYIGHGNAEIRRMRSAFNATEDASFMLRQQNQEKMRTFMKTHPFGVGIGKAKRAVPGDYMYQLPTDTTFVYIWVETGIIGLTIFLTIFLYAFLRGSYILWFRIQDRELKGLLSALLGGIAGMLVSSYGNEMLQQFPNGPTVYMCLAFVLLGPQFDKEISDNEIA
jgi:teichuronic acid biosynthesis protein TuaE